MASASKDLFLALEFADVAGVAIPSTAKNRLSLSRLPKEKCSEKTVSEQATGGVEMPVSVADRGATGVEAGLIAKKLEMDCCFCELLVCEVFRPVALGIVELLVPLSLEVANSEYWEDASSHKSARRAVPKAEG